MSANEDSEVIVAHEGLFGPAVQEFRTRAGLTQAELAERAGLHRSYLSSLENGKAPAAMRAVMRALRALDLEVVVRRRHP